MAVCLYRFIYFVGFVYVDGSYKLRKGVFRFRLYVSTILRVCTCACITCPTPFLGNSNKVSKAKQQQKIKLTKNELKNSYACTLYYV